MICERLGAIAVPKLFCGRPLRESKLDRTIIWCKTSGFCFTNIERLCEPALDIVKCGNQVIRLLLGRVFAAGIVDYGFERGDYEMNSVFCAGKVHARVARKGRQIVNFAPFDYIAVPQDLYELHQRLVRQFRIRFRVECDLIDCFENVASSRTKAKCCPDGGQFRPVQFVSQFLLILANGNSKCDEDGCTSADSNDTVHDDAGDVYIHPSRFTWPFEHAADNLRRQPPDFKRQQRYSAEFDRCAQSNPVLHHAGPVFDFRAIVARSAEGA